MSGVPKRPRVVVLGGGISSEREVSLASSRAVHEVLARNEAAQWIDLEEPSLPDGLDPAADVVFPVLHGAFGEDGGLQALLETAGFAYVGCDAEASALCMDKERSKARVGEAGVPVAPQVSFAADAPPAWNALCEAFRAEALVLKPASEGSSVGLHFVRSAEEWQSATRALSDRRWMVEPLLEGHDVTVGVLGGEPLGVVGIFPEGGAAYDYAHKYTAGATRYEVPAALPTALAEALRTAAARAFAAVGARDFARVDFIRQGDRFTFLEINTIPGLTATSLLPKSASICGLDFPTLVARMLAPAVARFHARTIPCHGKIF